MNGPIVVTVENGRWDAYSTNTPPTSRDLYLFGLLMGMGGIQDTVEDGRYFFDVTGGNLTSFTNVSLIKA